MKLMKRLLIDILPQPNTRKTKEILENKYSFYKINRNEMNLRKYIANSVTKTKAFNEYFIFNDEIVMLPIKYVVNTMKEMKIKKVTISENSVYKDSVFITEQSKLENFFNSAVGVSSPSYDIIFNKQETVIIFNKETKRSMAITKKAYDFINTIGLRLAYTYNYGHIAIILNEKGEKLGYIKGYKLNNELKNELLKILN